MIKNIILLFLFFLYVPSESQAAQNSEFAREMNECAARFRKLYEGAAESQKSYFRTESYNYYEMDAISPLRNQFTWTFLETSTVRGAFLKQTDPALLSTVQDPDAGLCGTACALNVTLAIRRYFNHSLREFENSEEFYQRMLTVFRFYTAKEFGRDITRGITISQIKHGLKEIFREINLDDAVKLKIINTSSAEWPAMLTLNTPSKRGTIWIGGFTGREIKPAGKRPSHAVVILNIDTANESILISDPNKPQGVRSLYYKQKTLPNGVSSLEVKLPDTDSTMEFYLDEILEIAPEANSVMNESLSDLRRRYLKHRR